MHDVHMYHDKSITAKIGTLENSPLYGIYLTKISQNSLHAGFSHIRALHILSTIVVVNKKLTFHFISAIILRLSVLYIGTLIINKVVLIKKTW